MIMKEADQVGGEIAAQDNDTSRAMNPFRDRGESISVQRVAELLQIPDVNVHGLADVCGKVRAFRLAGFHGVEGRGLRNGKLMQVMLKLPVAPKTHFHGYTQRRSGIDLQLMGQLADVKKYKVAGVFEYGSKQFLALGTKQAEGLGKIRPVVLRA